MAGAVGLFPFQKPHLPLQRWAKRAESCHASPLGMFIHPEHGLWHGYRCALALAKDWICRQWTTGLRPVRAAKTNPACRRAPSLRSAKAVTMCRFVRSIWRRRKAAIAWSLGAVPDVRVPLVRRRATSRNRLLSTCRPSSKHMAGKQALEPRAHLRDDWHRGRSKRHDICIQ
jgi:hypothetical protein